MINCKSITISNCPDDSTCEACKDIVKSQCIKYTGVDLTSIGIDNGDNLSEILIKLNSIIQDLSGQLIMN